MIVEYLGVSVQYIIETVESDPQLKASIIGKLAERKLLEKVRCLGLEGEMDNRHNSPSDVLIRGGFGFLGNQVKKISFKKDNTPFLDLSRGGGTTRLYRPTDFEILSVCLYPIIGWDEFRHRSVWDLRRDGEGFLIRNIPFVEVNTWTEDLRVVVEKAIRRNISPPVQFPSASLWPLQEAA